MLTNPTYLFTQLIIGEFDYFERQNFTRDNLLHKFTLEFFFKDKYVPSYYNRSDKFTVDISTAQILKMNLDAWQHYSNPVNFHKKIDPFLGSIYSNSKAILNRYDITTQEADIFYKDYLPLIQYLENTGKILTEYDYDYKVNYGAIPLDLDLVNIAFTRDTDKVKELITQGANPHYLYIENFYGDGDDDDNTSIISYFESALNFHDISLFLSDLKTNYLGIKKDFNQLFRAFFGLASSQAILRILKPK